MESPQRKTFSHQVPALPPVLLYAHPSMESLAMEIAERCASLSHSTLSTKSIGDDEAFDTDPTRSQVRLLLWRNCSSFNFHFSQNFYPFKFIYFSGH